MKTVLAFVAVLMLTLFARAQSGREDVLSNLEQGQGMQAEQQQSSPTATLKSAARLFGAKDDLTTVITIIPSGETVAILDSSDSTYYRVQYDETEGFILKRQAVIDKTPVTPGSNTTPADNSRNTASENVEGARPVRESTVSRFTYLENKYGTSLAARINSGKIWKGMNGEMVRDSWGNPNKINRVISSNIVKEEWTYKSTILYFQNNKLVEWGPVK